MSNPIKEKNIWLVGASTGIGFQLFEDLTAFAKNIIVSSRNTESLENFQSRYEGSCNIIIAKCDITNVEEVNKQYEFIVKKVGHLDLVILNAAVYEKTDVLKFNASEYKKQMMVNYCGSLNVVEPVIKGFIERKSGQLVVVSSISAIRALPGAAAYGASKAALSYFFESLRMHVEELGIKITIVLPGFVKTRLTEKNDFDMPLMISPEKASRIIINGIIAGQDTIDFPKGLTVPIRILRLLPEKWYRRLIQKFVMKKEK